MARPKDVARREEVLDAVLASLGHDGLGNRSLREIAEAAGTSHRMLIHHFESREGLLVAVVDAMEARQRERMAGLDPASTTFLADMWTELRDPENRGVERLFFECYARGANGEAPFASMHPESVTTWLASAEAQGIDPALARIGLALVRGLLLDLVATGDTRGVDAALARFAEIVQPYTSRA